VGVALGPSLDCGQFCLKAGAIRTAQISLPSFSERAQTNSSLPRWLIPYIRPAAMDGVLSPPPSPLIFQARGGPFFGHCLRRPVSLECAVRSGPCHCGQSSAEAEYNKNPVVRTLMIRFILIVSFVCFICWKYFSVSVPPV